MRDEEKKMSEYAWPLVDHETAWDMIQNDKDVIVVDVRLPFEYDKGHWPRAINVINEMIDADYAAANLPDKDAKYLIYCRTGNRSHQACWQLNELGYTNLMDGGGIMDWPYEIVKEKKGVSF